MPKAYSQDLRDRVIRSVDGGTSRRATAVKFEVSVSFVIRLVHQWRTSGSSRVRGTGACPVHRLQTHGALVDRLLGEQRDMTLDELRAALAREGVTVSRSAVDRYLTSRGLTRKKRQAMPQNKSAPMSLPHGLSGGKCSPD